MLMMTHSKNNTKDYLEMWFKFMESIIELLSNEEKKMVVQCQSKFVPRNNQSMMLFDDLILKLWVNIIALTNKNNLGKSYFVWKWNNWLCVLVCHFIDLFGYILIWSITVRMMCLANDKQFNWNQFRWW